MTRARMNFSVEAVGTQPVRVVPARRRPEPPDPGRPRAGARLISDVFDSLPTGVLVLTATGRVVTWNPALEQILGRSPSRAATCCTVLGCRQPGTPLEGFCLTERAIAAGERLSEVVLDHVPAAPGVSVAVGATPLHGGRERTVLVQIRPSERAPEQPPTPAPRPAGMIRIQTLGGTVVDAPQGEVRGDWLDQRTGRLLKFLVVHRGGPVHAETIAEALWPKADPDTTNTVRHFVHTLREKLEPERARYERSRVVVARHGGYQLNPDLVTIDAEEFEREARAGLIALAAGERERAVASLTSAIELYRGDFLVEERYEEWAVSERERLRDLAARPLRALATLADDRDKRAAYLERLAEMEPLDLDVQRELLSAWLQQGRRSRAIRHYRALQQRVMREFGERLSFDLAALAREACR